ncbi:nucleotide exchange factor GrpE [Chloroflexota bacterium]
MTRKKSDETRVQEEATETLEQVMPTEKEQTDNYLANWQRTQADFINYKKRSEQERLELSSMIKANIIYTLLPVLDNLERALEAVPPELGENSWVEGIKLTARNFQSILEAQGVVPIVSLGQDFDPRIHEAVRQDKGKEGTVIEEIQKGYKLNDTLVRPAMVVVGNGEED